MCVRSSLASDFEPERSPKTRALAEEALLRLLAALGDQDIDLVVLGGLVPEILTRGQAETIPGTSAQRTSTSTSPSASTRTGISAHSSGRSRRSAPHWTRRSTAGAGRFASAAHT